MNHEAKVIRIRRLIQEVRSEITAVQAKGGVAPDTNAHDALMAKIARWEATMVDMEKLMKSDLHFAYVQNAGGGRGASYAQRQRVASAQARHAGLRGLMTELAQAIGELIEAMSPDSVAWKHLGNALDKLTKAGGDDLSLDGVADRELVQVIRQNEPSGNAPGTPPHVVGVNLITLCLALFVILKRGRDR